MYNDTRGEEGIGRGQYNLAYVQPHVAFVEPPAAFIRAYIHRSNFKQLDLYKLIK